MKRIFSYLFAILFAVGTTGVFTSCQEDAVEIDYTISVTVNNDLTEVINAINNGNLSNGEGIQSLVEAINKLSGDQETKYQALLNAINGLATTLEAKLAVIEAAMKAQTVTWEGKIGLLEAAIKALPDYTEKLTALQTSIDAIAKAVEEGNKNQEDALAEILALLEGIDTAVNPDYVTFTADATQTLSYQGSDLQYSTDGTTFQALPANTSIEFGGNKKLYLRGVNNLDGNFYESGGYTLGYQISFGNDAVPVACTGDIRTLIDYETYKTVDTSNAKFISLFKDCTELISAPALPATDLADYLTKKGIAFRSAYKTVGEIVGYRIANGLVLETMPLEKYKEFEPTFSEDLYDAISLKTCVETRISAGGTGRASVEKQIEYITEFINK